EEAPAAQGEENAHAARFVELLVSANATDGFYWFPISWKGDLDAVLFSVDLKTAFVLDKERFRRMRSALKRYQNNGMAKIIFCMLIFPLWWASIAIIAQLDLRDRG